MDAKQVICDTDVIIDYWNHNSSRHLSAKYLLEEVIVLQNIFLSAVTQMELIVGAINGNDLIRIKRNIHQFKIALINNTISELAVDLLQTYRLSDGLALADALIASTALTLEMRLLTFNIKDYRFVSELYLFDNDQ